MNIDALVAHYVALRDTKEALQQQHKDELAPLNADMQKLEQALQVLMQQSDVQSFKTKHGTAYTSVVANAKVVDFEATLAFIRDNERYDLLERRVNKTLVQEIGEVPGVELTRTIKVNVRRK